MSNISSVKEGVAKRYFLNWQKKKLCGGYFYMGRALQVQDAFSLFPR